MSAYFLKINCEDSMSKIIIVVSFNKLITFVLPSIGYEASPISLSPIWWNPALVAGSNRTKSATKIYGIPAPSVNTSWKLLRLHVSTELTVSSNPNKVIKQPQPYLIYNHLCVLKMPKPFSKTMKDGKVWLCWVTLYLLPSG